MYNIFVEACRIFKTLFIQGLSIFQFHQHYKSLQKTIHVFFFTVFFFETFRIILNPSSVKNKATLGNAQNQKTL